MPPQDPNVPQPGFTPPTPPQPNPVPPAPQPVPTPPQPEPVLPQPGFTPPTPPQPATPTMDTFATPQSTPAAAVTPEPMSPAPGFTPPAPAAASVNLPPPTDPNTPAFGAPQPAPFTQAAPSTPLQAPYPSTPSMAPITGGGGSKLPKIIGAGLAVLLILVGGFFAAKSLLGGGVTLVEFSNSSMSFLYPDKYEKTETSRTVRFREEGEANTASSVYASVTPIPSYAQQSQIDEAIDEIKGKIKGEIEESLPSGSTLKDYKVDEVQFEGKKALRFKTIVEDDGKKIGEVSGLFGQGDKSLFTIEVLAHVSDKGVMKSANKIIDSMKPKATSEE